LSDPPGENVGYTW